MSNGDEFLEPLQTGAPVIKCTGDYTWKGEVRSVFSLPDGKIRYVVAHPVDTGWVLHIYSRANLRKL